MSMKFASDHVFYTEDRADGGFFWDVSYDLAGTGDAAVVTLKIDLTGDDPGPVGKIWLDGINSIWNHKAFFSDGRRLYEVKVNASFVDKGAHQVVTVHDGAGRDDISNWYLQQPEWGQKKLDEIAAHEVGHMLGNFDEYTGGATYDGYTATGTLMSDLTVHNVAAYFWTVEYAAEKLSGLTLETIGSTLGDGGGDVYTGTSLMDGVYGLGGQDSLSGMAGNDFLDGGKDGDSLSGGDGNDILKGGNGNDILTGGRGRDTLNGGGGADSFTFDTVAARNNIDRVSGYQDGTDDIWLDMTVFTGITPVNFIDTSFLHQGDLAAGALVIGSKARDANDRIIFDTAAGLLSYDPDGTGAAAAQGIAILSNFKGAIDAGDFVIFRV